MNILSAIVFLILIVSGMAAEPAGIRLQGTYDYTAYERERPVYTEEFDFEVLVRDSVWVIRYNLSAGATNTDVLDKMGTASCDGTNIYLSIVQNPEVVKEAWKEKYSSVADKLPAAVARIYPGQYPPPREVVLQNLWLAFISSGKLPGPQGKAKPPFYVDLAIFYDPNYDCDYKWVDEGEPVKLHQLVLTSDGRCFRRDHATGKVLSDKYDPPFDNGYKTGVGRWLRTTNLAGITFPMDFEFAAFGPESIPSNHLTKAFAYRCQITNVSMADLPSIPVALPKGKILFADRRMASQGYGYLSYETSQGWIGTDNNFFRSVLSSAPKISLEEEALTQIGLKRPGSSSKNPSKTPRSKTVRILIYSICTGSLAVLFLAVKRSSANNKTKCRKTKESL